MVLPGRPQDSPGRGQDGVVLWDFDGTLAWRSGMWRAALITALDRVSDGHGLGGEELRSGLQNGFPWHRPDDVHLHLDTAQAWWAALHPMLVHAYEQAGVDHDLAVAAATRVPEAYVDPSYWTVFDDTRPVLTRLREAGWRHVVLSNHVPELPNLVHDLGLDDLIADVITSAVTGYEKPHPQMFTDAIHRVGSPERVWMVGDSPTADIAGAERAGISALLVRTSPAPGIPGRDLHWAADLILARTTSGASAGPAG